MLGIAMLCTRARLLLDAGGHERCSASRRKEKEEEEGAAAAVARMRGAEEDDEDGDGRSSPRNASALTANRASRHKLTSNRMLLGKAPRPPARRRRCSMECMLLCAM